MVCLLSMVARIFTLVFCLLSLRFKGFGWVGFGFTVYGFGFRALVTLLQRLAQGLDTAGSASGSRINCDCRERRRAPILRVSHSVRQVAQFVVEVFQCHSHLSSGGPGMLAAIP